MIRVNTGSLNLTVKPIRLIDAPGVGMFWIKAIACDVSEIHHFATASRAGQLFSFTLKDESAAIRATAFHTQVDRFFPLISDGDTYLVGGFFIRKANSAYNNTGHLFELDLNNGTQAYRQTRVKIGRRQPTELATDSFKPQQQAGRGPTLGLSPEVTNSSPQEAGARDQFPVSGPAADSDLQLKREVIPLVVTQQEKMNSVPSLQIEQPTLPTAGRTKKRAIRTSDFVLISHLRNHQPGSVVSVLCVIKEVGEHTTKEGDQLRQIVIADRTSEIKLTMSHADTWTHVPGTVLAIRHVTTAAECDADPISATATTILKTCRTTLLTAVLKITRESELQHWVFGGGCRGRCMTENRSVSTCDPPCVMVPCPGCLNELPRFIFDDNHGYCTDCCKAAGEAKQGKSSEHQCRECSRWKSWVDEKGRCVICSAAIADGWKGLRYCRCCKSPNRLPPIGDARQNGKAGTYDFSGRLLHLWCRRSWSAP